MMWHVDKYFHSDHKQYCIIHWVVPASNSEWGPLQNKWCLCDQVVTITGSGVQPEIYKPTSVMLMSFPPVELLNRRTNKSVSEKIFSQKRLAAWCVKWGHERDMGADLRP